MPEGKEEGHRKGACASRPGQVPALSGLFPAMGDKRRQGHLQSHPPASGHLPKTPVSSGPGQLTWGAAVPAGRQAVGWRLRAYLGFELFQKTVWRSAAARLQQRPKRGAQRNSIARGLARPGEDEGAPRGPGSRRLSPRRTARRAHRSGPSAWRLRLLGQRRATPRPAPAPPRQRLPWGLGAGEVEVEEGRAG